jgi:thioredoxin 1
MSPWVEWRKKKMAFQFTDVNFQKEALESELPVLVDFYADWCGPCKMVAPIVAELADEYAGVYKIGKLNVDNEPNTAEKYRVMSIPTLMIIKNGEVVDKIVGAVPKTALKEKLEAHK